MCVYVNGVCVCTWCVCVYMAGCVCVHGGACACVCVCVCVCVSVCEYFMLVFKNGFSLTKKIFFLVKSLKNCD